MKSRQAEMLGHVASWRSSGLTQKAYCKEVGLNSVTFNYWVRKESKQTEVKKKEGFVAVKKKVNVEQQATFYKITYPNGVQLETNTIADLSTLIHLY